MKLNIAGLTLMSEHGQEVIYKCPRVHTTGRTQDLKGHLYVNKSRGVWYCFKCQNGGYIEGVEREMKEVLQDATQLLSSRVEPPPIVVDPPKGLVSFRDAPRAAKKSLADYLEAHNLYFRHVEPYGILYYPVGTSGNYGCMYLPYFDREVSPEGGIKKHLTFYVLRYIMGESQNRYIMPAGLSYGPHLYLNTWAYEAEPMFLVEGVMDAIRVNMMGKRAIALGGRYFNPILLPKLNSLGATGYIILLDNDAVTDAVEILHTLRLGTGKSVEIRTIPGKDPAELKDEQLKGVLR